MADFVDPIDRLQSQLMTSGLQVKDNPLFQVIQQLIKSLQKLQSQTGSNITTIINNPGAPANLTYITETDETAILTFSRRLAAGTGITLDVSVPAIMTINASASPSGVQWSVVTNGNVDNPELVFAGGDVIMTHIP